jgi:Cysteine rich repeat
MRIPRAIKLTAPLAVLLAVTFSPAYAEHGGRPCRKDIKALCQSQNITPGPGAFRDCLGKLCPDIAPGHGAFLSCLQKYTLSTACQEHLNTIQARITAWEQACQTDVTNLCGDVTPGQGNIIRCLRQNQSQLSPSCAAQFAQHRKHHKRHHHEEPTPNPAP